MGKIRSILVIFFTLVVFCNCQSENPVASSWAKLQISPDTLSNMEYGNFLIRIYEHANNNKATTTDSQKKYFYQPIAVLDNKSAVSKFNRITKQQEMIFFIEMWNNKIQNQVVQHISKKVKYEVQSSDVTIIPVEKVILTSTVTTDGYSLSPVWTDYDKSKTLRLSLSCYDASVCDEMANEMQSNPEQFYHLKLLYSLSSQTSQKREMKITIDSVTSGDMVTKLLQTFGDKKEIFLTATDEKKMLAETATNIRMETFDDSEVTSADTESQIYNILKDLMVTSRTNIKEQSDEMWDSVFWNEDNYRPDKTTKTLNEILDKLDSETQKKLGKNFQNAEKKSEIIEILTSAAKYEEKRREEQVRREKQTKDVIEKEEKNSGAIEDGQHTRIRTRDDQSSNQREDVEISGGGFGVTLNAKSGVEKSDTHNTEQEKETNINTKKSSDEQNRNAENKERTQNNFDSNSRADVDIKSSTNSEKTANDFDRSRRMETLQDDVEKFLVESRKHVQWDGEKFVPKPMQLSRINLAKFRDSQLFQERNVRVRYTTAELLAPIKFMEHAQLTVTDEWNNLKDELKATTELLNTTVNHLVKTNSELINVKEELNNTRFNLTNEIERTKIELEKINSELVDVKRDLTNESKAKTYQLTYALEIAGENLKKYLRDNLETITTDFATKSELMTMKSNVADLATKLKSRTSEIVDIGKMPSSCLDLERMGQKISGFFSVNEGLEKIEIVYCDFFPNQNDKQKFIGYVDVKSTLSDLETKTTDLKAIRSELMTIADLTTKLNARTSDIVDIGQMPTNCEDLQRMGHKLSGFFSVKGQKKIKIVYCNFYPNGKDKHKLIGYADVKSALVHFYAQRNSSYGTTGTPIPFDFARVNHGYAMDLATGIFKAPRPGIYFFSFTGMARFPSSSSSSSALYLTVAFKLNKNQIGRSNVQESNTVDNQESPLTLQLTLSLERHDQVWLEILGSSLRTYLFDNKWLHLTHFTGFMLEEEIESSIL